MLRIKRLYLFMLQSFVPLFCMTFFICLFIVLMQFLWRFIDDLVGKGLGIDVIGELFFYAALTMIPMALPLAVLLASLMTFGNLGEHFELTAMKASGVSLIRSMKPLIWLMVFIAVGAFFFQNNVLPVAQTKMWTLLYSMKQKSPELEIPEGQFYDQIPGYNLFVQHKNPQTGILYDVMIYDIGRGADNATVITADSARLAFTADKTHLYLKLWQGEQFENLKDAGGSGSQLRNVPYRRESFKDKELTVHFDANFNRLDEQNMRSQYVGKNIAELRQTIDSIEQRVDSAGALTSQDILTRKRVGTQYWTYNYKKIDPKTGPVKERIPDVALDHPLNIDSIFSRGNATYDLSYLNIALGAARRTRQEVEFRSIGIGDDLKNIRKHAIELQKKFTLSFACIIFFFIGAPLGAIIRKGGLGVPIVISVLLFIVYYIIDNTGYKMAREGRVDVWQGMWLSSAVLLPLGIFLTYKAVNDSAVFNSDTYVNFFRRLMGRNSARKLEMREVVMERVELPVALQRLDALKEAANRYLAANPAHQGYLAYFLRGYSRGNLKALSAQLEETVDYLANSRNRMVVIKLMDYPVLRSLWLYHPTNYPWLGWALIALFPIGLPIWLAGLREQRILRDEIHLIATVSLQISALLTEENPAAEPAGSPDATDGASHVMNNIK